MIRFQLDEQIAKAIAVGLRRRGIDVRTTFEAGLIGASDLDQLAAAEKSGRVFVTQDEDFLVLHARGIPHAGIVYGSKGSKTIGPWIDTLELIARVMTPDEMANHVEYA
jgi:hypothetical protein